MPRADTFKRNFKHGHDVRGKRTAEYRTWIAMRERCSNPKHVGFKYYGARGIKVCERWRNDFSAFLSDMGHKPSSRHSLDRHPDLNGNYEPNNCRWATPAQQRANQRRYDESSRVRKAWETRTRVSNNRMDLTGQRFDRLMVIAYADTNNRRARWLCRCDCGTDAVVVGKSLRNGNTRSCGCLNRETARARAIQRNKKQKVQT